MTNVLTVGNIYADNNPRSAGREVKLISIHQDGFAEIETVRDAHMAQVSTVGRTTYINPERLSRGGSRGYTLIKDNSAQSLAAQSAHLAATATTAAVIGTAAVSVKPKPKLDINVGDQSFERVVNALGFYKLPPLDVLLELIDETPITNNRTLVRVLHGVITGAV